MDITTQQQRSTLHTEFDIVVPEHVLDEVEFEADRVDFCFVPQMFTEHLRCFIKFFDAQTQQQILGGVASIDLPKDSTEPRWVSASEFGYHDEKMRHLINKVRYEIWAEGTGRVTVRIYV